MKINEFGAIELEAGEVIKWDSRPLVGKSITQQAHKAAEFSQFAIDYYKSLPGGSAVRINDNAKIEVDVIDAAPSFTFSLLSDAAPLSSNDLEFSKSFVAGLSKADQQSLYEFMHDTLDLRIW